MLHIIIIIIIIIWNVTYKNLLSCVSQKYV